MRIHQDHWALLLDFCEKYPQLITNKFNGPNGRIQFLKLWKELCTMLNSLGYGEKTEIEWKKALTDWKSKTNAKAGAIKIHASQTGGGESTTLVLTANEERLLMLMGKKAVEGDSSVPEIGIRKRKIEEAKENIAGSSGVMVAIEGHSSKVCIPLQRMTPVTAAIETLSVDQGRNCSKPQIQTPTTPEVSTPTSRKRQRLDDFVHTNNKLLSTLRSINSNIAAMNGNFEKLITLLEQKLK